MRILRPPSLVDSSNSASAPAEAAKIAAIVPAAPAPMMATRRICIVPPGPSPATAPWARNLAPGRSPAGASASSLVP
jgi:hypothetical protein